MTASVSAFQEFDNVALWSRRPRRIVAEPANHDWRAAVGRRLDELVKLPKGWDGYSGIAPTFQTANFALLVMSAIMPPKAPAPQLVPGALGDIQLEWHGSTGSIELQVLGPNRSVAWRQIIGGDEEEVSLTIDYSAVAQWLVDLMEPPLAVGSAAAG